MSWSNRAAALLLVLTGLLLGGAPSAMGQPVVPGFVFEFGARYWYSTG